MTVISGKHPYIAEKLLLVSAVKILLKLQKVTLTFSIADKTPAIWVEPALKDWGQLL